MSEDIGNCVLEFDGDWDDWEGMFKLANGFNLLYFLCVATVHCQSVKRRLNGLL